MTDWLWWQRGVIYQVYPRSFQDSDGDGIGDLRGIRTRLGHLKRLGVTALWLSPVYPSPMADFGYDVADYCDIDPMFGTLVDFDRLVSDAHAQGLHVILDYVPNHTSDRHPWFVESRSSRTSAKRDWYIWRDPAPGGGPPNNWLGRFGGSGWEFDASSGQYYLHSFLREQPDLNWRNPAVRAAMYDVLRFWMRRGVDGFRIDVLWLLIKDDAFRDNPPNPDWRPGMAEHDRLLPVWNADRPETLEVLTEMRRVADEFPERMIIGEIYLPLDRLVAYYGPGLDGANLPFNFQLILATWSAPVIAKIIANYEAALPRGAWPNWVLGNHDQPRIATRVGPAQARVAAMLLLTLRGTPTIYQGEEIGMTDVVIPPDRIQDPAEKRQPGVGAGRDPQRTPMQWDATANAGFTTGTPWLPLAPDAARVNVAVEQGDPHAMLPLYQALIGLRQSTPALSIGEISGIRADGDMLSFERHHEIEHYAVLLNMKSAPARVAVAAGRIVLTTDPTGTAAQVGGDVLLRADEGIVVELSAPREPARGDVPHG